VAAVEHGTRTTYFAEHVSAAETRWPVGVLKAAVRARTGRTV